MTSVHGMLHKSDISAAELQSLRSPLPVANTKIPGPKPLLEKNTLVTVYVKDVYKQSGWVCSVWLYIVLVADGVLDACVIGGSL